MDALDMLEAQLHNTEKSIESAENEKTFWATVLVNRKIHKHNLERRIAQIRAMLQ
jgi:hypothetical protein